MTGIDLRKYTATQPKQKSRDKAKETVSAFSFLKEDIFVLNKELSDKKKERFYAQFYLLFKAGLDIKSCLDLVQANQKEEADKQFYTGLIQSIMNGNSLSEAMKISGKFSSYEYYSIQIGEETGQLNKILSELTAYFQKQIQLRRKIINIFTYPLFLSFAMLGTIIFMMTMLVPMFANIFKRMGQELPFLTQLIVDISEWLADYFYIPILIIIGIILFVRLNKNQIWFRKFFSSFVLSIPVVGKIIKKIYLGRFCNSMTLLIGAKVPMLRAIDLVKAMVSFYPIEISLNRAKEDILQGISLHKTLEKSSVYDKELISLIKVGEEVNQLDTIFQNLSKQYNEEVDHQAAVLGTLFEPVLMVILGAMVAIIAIAIYIPILKMSTGAFM